MTWERLEQALLIQLNGYLEKSSHLDPDALLKMVQAAAIAHDKAKRE